MNSSYKVLCNRALSDNDIKSITDNPYQMFKSPCMKKSIFSKLKDAVVMLVKHIKH